MPRFGVKPGRAPRRFCLQGGEPRDHHSNHHRGRPGDQRSQHLLGDGAPTAALVISIVTLAGIGALLGACTGWAVITGDEPEARVWPELEEWLAA
jgi:hypothetical protein